MKKNFLGFIILLLLVFVGAILLLDFTDNAPEALLKKTVYTLYSDTVFAYVMASRYVKWGILLTIDHNRGVLIFPGSRK